MDHHKTPSSRANLQDVDSSWLNHRIVLVRTDFDVQLDPSRHHKGKDNVACSFGLHSISNDSKIRESMETILFVLKKGARVLLLSHLGSLDYPDIVASEPEAKTNGHRMWFRQDKSLQCIMYTLQNLLPEDANYKLEFCEDCIGPKRQEKVEKMKRGELDICLLENTRFYREELFGSPEFSLLLALDVDIFVNDAFGVSNHPYSSTTLKPFLKAPSLAVAGFQFQREQNALSSCLTNPTRPLAVVVGGSKVGAKLPILRSLLSHADKILIGGGTVYPFLRAAGHIAGAAFIDDASLHEAKAILELANKKGVKIVVAFDFVCVQAGAVSDASPLPLITCSVAAIPTGFVCRDVGPATTDVFKAELETCKTILWNGPLGVYEHDKFSNGTNRLIDMLRDFTERGAVTVIAGEDTAKAVEKHLHLNDKVRLTVAAGGHGHSGLRCREFGCFSHVSLSGEAGLAFLANPENMPGIKNLSFCAEIPETLRRCSHHAITFPRSSRQYQFPENQSKRKSD